MPKKQTNRYNVDPVTSGVGMTAMSGLYQDSFNKHLDVYKPRWPVVQQVGAQPLPIQRN